jgi:hypothetical protein
MTSLIVVMPQWGRFFIGPGLKSRVTIWVMPTAFGYSISIEYLEMKEYI